MYAVIEDGSMQYKVAEGETLDIDFRKAEPGERIEFHKVLLLSADDTATVGTPTIPDVRVVAEVVDQTKGPKIAVMRFRRRKRERRKVGHRQRYTRVKIKEIVVPGKAAAAPASESATAEIQEEGSTNGS